MTHEQFDKLLDAALRRHVNAPQDDQAAVERVMRRLAAPLPRQKMSWGRLPAVLLDWQFAPAWPRVAALGACMVLGFAIGISGLDRPIDQLNTTIGQSSGIGALVFEPEALTGARP